VIVYRYYISSNSDFSTVLLYLVYFVRLSVFISMATTILCEKCKRMRFRFTMIDATAVYPFGTT
jgi:hypothetical protein